MTEDDARRVALLRGFESPLTAPWTDADAQWASDEARRELGERSDSDAFLATRARLGCERLQQRVPAVGSALDRSPASRTAWVLVAMVLAAGALGYGLGAASIGPDGRLHLMAPPLGGLLVWNALAVGISVLGLLGAAAKTRSTSAPHGANRSALAAWLAAAVQRVGGGLRDSAAHVPSRQAADTGAALARGWAWAGSWMAASLQARVAAALHLGAAALVISALAALYARGLGEAFYAGWDSTFVSAEQAHALVQAVLGPASQALHMALPNAEEFEGLRLTKGPGAPAAPWIHLWALTLLLAAALPRLLLAAGSWLSARRHAAEVTLPMSDAYFSRLVAQQGLQAIELIALPYGHRPEASFADWLSLALKRRLGPRCGVRVLAPILEGDEDNAPVPPRATALAPSGGLVRLAVLVTLTATPERETHGRFLRAVAARAGATEPHSPVILIVSEAGFGARLAASDAESRRRHRRAAWRELAHELGSPVLFVDPSRAEAPGTARDQADDERAVALGVN